MIRSLDDLLTTFVGIIAVDTSVDTINCLLELAPVIRSELKLGETNTDDSVML